MAAPASDKGPKVLIRVKALSRSRLQEELAATCASSLGATAAKQKSPASTG
jgi:hypothetical protein